MGCCLNTQTEINPVSESDVRFGQFQSTQKNLIKILLLGTSDCGKTTILKQLQHINNVYQHNNSYNNMSSFIKQTVVADMKTLCHQSLLLNQTVQSLHFRGDMLALQLPYILTSDIALKIKVLYSDNGIRQTLKKRNDFQIGDNIIYFLNKIDEIAMDEYIPSIEDCVRIYRRSVGYSTTKFAKYVDNFGEYNFEIPDIGGAKSERKKWLNPKLLLDPNVNTIIYVVAISEYNMVLYEDNTTNRLVESINCFKQIIKFLKNKSIILLFNKYDIFQRKIKTTPITVAFDNFPNDMIPTEANDVIRFIAGQFLQVLKEYNVNLNKPLRIIRTTAIDIDNVNEMFNKIAPEIVTNFTNFKNANKNFKNPLIVPRMQRQGSLPTHSNYDHLPSDLLPKLKHSAHSLPISVNSKTI